MAELDNSALINDLLSGLLLEEVEQNAPVEPKGLMSSKTGTNTSADAAAAEAELQPKSGRASITEFIQKLSAADTPNEGESGGTLESANYLTMDDMYRKYNTPLYKLGSLNRDRGSDEDAAALKVKRNTNFGDAYLDSLGADMDKSDTNSKRENILSEGKASTLFDRKAAEDLASNFLEGLQDKYQEKRINPNVKSFPEQDSFTATELDGAAVGGASDGKVDEGLMSRPYDKEAMLDINEPLGEGVKYDFMLPNSKFRKALKDKEAESYSTIFGDLQKIKSPFKGTDVTNMTMKEVLEFVKLNGKFHKYNKKTFNKNTTAIGKYQFIGSTLRSLKERGVFDKLNISDDTLFDVNTQDKLSAYQAVHRLKDRAGLTYASARKEMRNEWEGFKKLTDTELDSIIDEIGSEIGLSFSDSLLNTSLRPKARPTKLASN